jgi:GT2 family glycosyltransferase
VNATIVIPTIHARPDLLKRCMDECYRTMRADDQLLVLDGGTFAENCNGGASLAATDILIFLNDDTKPDQDDWIDRLLDPFQWPTVGIVGARLIYPNGALQHTGVYLENDATGIVARNRTWDSPSGPVDAVTGAVFAIRASIFRELNGFDTAFRNGYEDIDLCLRARQAGHTIWYQAECTVIHHEHQSGPARWQWVNENIVELQSRYVLASD